MKRNRFLCILLILLSSTWNILYFCFYANIDPYLLSWARSFKDDAQPVLSKLRFSRSKSNNIFNLSITNITNKKKIIKEKQKHSRQTTTKRYNKTFFLKHYFNDFKTSWCRIQQAKLDWKKYLEPCAKHTKWNINYAGWKNSWLKTSAANSFISKWDIRPAGEFSRFFIQSKTSSNHTKNIGGDSWRIHIKGTSSVSATVFDQNNGVYEVVFLLMEAGLYQIEIILDYTLCDGFKDPPVDWYKKGGYQGKNQPDGVLKGDRPFLMESFHGGKPVWIKIPVPKYSKKDIVAMEKIRKTFFDRKENGCGVTCPSLIFDGLGRWINGTWKPFSQELKIKHEPHDHKGMLWFYGDSVSKSFAVSLVTGPYREICIDVFKQCQVTYSWVYNVKNAAIIEDKLDGKDYDHEKVMKEINKVLEDKNLDEHSVSILNWGIHFAAAVNFTNYKKLIDEFLETQVKQNKNNFKGKIIWRTTTALFRERFLNPHKDVRRFLTSPRIILYNAYAMSAMCKAGVDVIDTFPMTDSFPPGTISTRDPVHYDRRAMESVEALLYHKYH